MLGPLAGAAVLAVADWRAIFWLNLLLGVGLAGGVAGVGAPPPRPGRPRAGRRHRGRARPAARRAGRARRGRHARPALRAAGRGRRGVDAADPAHGRSPAPPWSRAASPCPAGAVLPLRGLPRLAGEVDVLGSALAVVSLGSLVWAFAAADPATQVVAHGAVLLPVALVAAVAFVLRERRAADPVLPLAALRPVGAWGALLVNLLVGVALVAALVDIPLFARNTTTPGDQLGAALVLLRLLVAVPVGAVARRLAVPHRRPARGGGRGHGAGLRRVRRHDRLGRAVPRRRCSRPSSCSARVWASGWPSRRSTPCCSPSPAPTCTAAPARWPSSRGRSACSPGCRCSPPWRCAGSPPRWTPSGRRSSCARTPPPTARPTTPPPTRRSSPSCTRSSPAPPSPRAWRPSPRCCS